MLEATVKKVLRDFTLDVKIRAGRGEIVVIMGENGAGKSTTLNLISGLVTPDTGSIRLNGTHVFDAGTGIEVPVEDRRIGYVFQNSAVFPHLTVYENIAFGLRAMHLNHETMVERAGHWIKKMDLVNISAIRAGSLSGGQRQRVALARALAISPALLMLDEPFAALDVQSTVSVKDAICRCVAELEIPCLAVTHRIVDACDVGDRICVLSQGKNVWEGKPGDMPAGVCGCWRKNS